MKAASAALLRAKLVSLESHLQELGSYVEVDAASYLSQPALRRAAERMVQVVVESAIDIAEALIEAAGAPPPATAREAFGVLLSLGVLDRTASDQFGRRYVGPRNRIVHDYEPIDDTRVHQGGKSLLDDARCYARAVSAWLDRQPAGAPATGVQPS